MSNWEREEQARREGMSYALQVAKEKGIDALEEDLKMRRALKVPVGVSRRAVNECIANIKNNAVDTVQILSAMCLRDEFDFGAKRIQRFRDRFDFKADCLFEQYVTWPDMIRTLKEELGIEYSIRQNYKDTDPGTPAPKPNRKMRRAKKVKR